MENALYHRYYSGLPDCIQDIISTCEGGKPFTLQTLYSTAISINNYLWERKHESERALHSILQHSLHPEYSEFVSNVSLSGPGSDVEASESSDEFSTWQHTPSPDLSDSVSKLSSSVSNSGSIIAKSLTSALFFTLCQIPSSKLSDSASVLSFLTSGSDSRILESPVKLKSLC